MVPAAPVEVVALSCPNPFVSVAWEPRAPRTVASMPPIAPLPREPGGWVLVVPVEVV